MGKYLPCKLNTHMKLAVSNIAWPIDLNRQMYKNLQDLGIEALEIAPTKIWPDIYAADQTSVQDFLIEIQSYNLKVCGFHSLLYGTENLSIFAKNEDRIKTINYLKKLAELCHLTGGKTLVFGSPVARQKEHLHYNQALEQATEFFQELLSHCTKYNVVFVIEPLSTELCDFINNTTEALELITQVNHPKFQAHFDLQALIAADEINLNTFQNSQKHIKHFHINGTNLGPLKEEDKELHNKVTKLIHEIDYSNYISLEQRPDKDNPIKTCLDSIKIMRKYYV